MSCKTNVEPLQLSFSNVTLTTDGRANSNGIALQVGTPGQILALTPSTLVADSVLTNRATCGTDANSSCIQSIGGGFDASASSSFIASTADGWNGSSVKTDLGALINVPSTYFNDLLTVAVGQTSQKLPGFPLILNPAAGSIYSQLGLGPNSTFVNRLVEAGLAPSRSWSFFAGVYSGMRAGLLTIGGSADRFYQGGLATRNVTEGDTCDFCFNVTHMSYQDGGRNISLMPDGASSFVAAIDPYYPTMIVSNSTLEKFGNATNGRFSAQVGVHVYASDAVPTGNITVRLHSGLVTTIPNKALFDPPAYDNGILADYRNGSSSTVYGVFSPWNAYVKTPPDSNIALFGMPFASMVYLIRDYERQTVAMGNANQDAQLSGGARTICPLNESSHKSSSHTGAIAGGVVGGVVGLALIAFLAWFFWRRKKRAAASKAGAGAKDSDIADSGTSSDAKPELAASGTVVQNRTSIEKPAEPVERLQEMSSEPSMVEMPGTQAPPPSELPAQGKVVRSELPA